MESLGSRKTSDPPECDYKVQSSPEHYINIFNIKMEDHQNMTSRQLVNSTIIQGQITLQSTIIQEFSSNLLRAFFLGFYLYAIIKVGNYSQAIKKVEFSQVPLL